MKVISPVIVNDSYFSSSNVTESHPAWSAYTAYAVDDVVVYNTTGVHKLFLRLVAGMTPATPNNDPDNWVDYGPTNTWAMLDTSTSTPTVMANLINLVLLVDPGTISVALFGLVGTSVNLIVSSRDTSVPSTSKTIAITGTDKHPAQLFELDLAVPANSKLEIVINGTVAKCGACVVGSAIFLGVTQPNPKVNFISYSVKDTDKYGTTTFTKGANSKRVSTQIETINDDVDVMLKTIGELDGVPCAWQVSDISKFSFLNGFGFVKDAAIDVAYTDTSISSLEIEYLA